MKKKSIDKTLSDLSEENRNEKNDEKNIGIRHMPDDFNKYDGLPK